MPSAATADAECMARSAWDWIATTLHRPRHLGSDDRLGPHTNLGRHLLTRWTLHEREDHHDEDEGRGI